MYQSGFRFVRFVFLGLSLSLLSACGLPGPGSSTNPQKNNNGNNPNQYEDVVKVFIETNEAMRTSWQGDLFNLITPQKALALRGLREIGSLPDTAISVVTLDEDFRDRGRIADPFVVNKNDVGNYYDLLFQTKVEKQLNQVVRVTLPNNEVMYSPLEYKTVDFDNQLVVNVASHYVLKKLYDAITTREQLQDLLGCGEEKRNTNCSHQPRVKIKHVFNLIELVNNYDLEITPEMTVQDAVEMFDENPILRSMVETGIQEILRTTSPVTRGTAREVNRTDLEDEQQFRSLTYNSTWFALDLSTIEPNSSINRVNIGAATSLNIPEGAARPSNALPIYATLTHNSHFLEFRTDGLTIDIPYTRSNMAYTRNNLFTLTNNSNIFLAHSANPIETFLSTEGNIMAGAVLEQNIDSRDIGWQSNPVYKQLYRVNQYEPNLDPDSTASNTTQYPDSTPWLVSANIMKAENYSTVEANDDRVRVEWLEDRYVFSWEVHGEQADTGFSTTRLRNKTYGVLRYGLRLGNSDPVVQLTAETQLWEALPANQIQITQPEAHYRSHQLSRNTLHEVTGPTTLPASTSLHSYSSVLSKLSSSDIHNRGLISLESGSRGHASSNGSHFSLIQNLSVNNIADRIFIVGSELYSGPGVFSNEQYLLQGNTMGLSNLETRLASLNQSTLELSNSNSGCEAELTVRHLSVSQDISENTLGTPTTTTEDPVSSSSCEIDGSKITVEFSGENNEVLGQPLTLTGFFSKSETGAGPSNLINLLWLQEDNMGLVFATRDQQLPHNFDPDQPNND